MDVLGEEIKVGWQHLLIVFAVPIGLSFLMGIAGLAYAWLSGASDILDALYGNLMAMAPVYSLIASPLLAYLYLRAVRLMALSGDQSRSLAAAEFLVWGVGIGILGTSASLMLGLHKYYALPVAVYLGMSFANTLLNSFVSSMITFLWLRLLAVFDPERLKAIAPSALLYALTAYAAESALVYLLSISGLDLWLDDFTWSGMLFSIAMGFMFALPVLHVFGKPGPWSYLFAIAFTMPFMLSMLAELAFSVVFASPYPYAVHLAVRLIQLALLFFIARTKDVFKFSGSK